MTKYMKIKKDSELARIIADLTGDGHLQYDGKRGVIFFYSKYLKSVKSFSHRFEKIFGVKGRIRKLKYTGKAFTIRYEVHFSSKGVAKILYELGTPAGNKANNLFSVPNWILNGNRTIKKEYLRGIYTAEGSIYPTKIRNGVRWRIEIEQYKKFAIKEGGIKFILQIKNMLGGFGIVSSAPRFGKKQARKDGSETIAIKMDIESKYFGRFYKEIGFDNKLKTNRLLKSLREKERGL